MMKQYSKRIHFISNISDIKIPSDTKLFQIDCKAIKTTKELFTTFSRILEFPTYFGNNWDAFNECFWDLEWIQDKYNVSNVDIYLFNIKNLLDKENLHEKMIFFEIMNSDYVVNENDEQGKTNFPVNIQLYFNKDEEKYFLPTEPTMIWDSNDQ